MRHRGLGGGLEAKPPALLDQREPPALADGAEDRTRSKGLPPEADQSMLAVAEAVSQEKS